MERVINKAILSDKEKPSIKYTETDKGSGRWGKLMLGLANGLLAFSTLVHPVSAQSKESIYSRDPVAEGDWVIHQGWLNVLVVCANEGQSVDLYFKDAYNVEINGADLPYARNFLVVNRNRTSGLSDLRDNNEPLLLGSDNIGSRVTLSAQSVNAYSTFSRNRDTTMIDPTIVGSAERIDVRRLSVRFPDARSLDKATELCW